MRSVAFVAGATGYTGRHVVKALRAGHVSTHAHVRPDSPRSDEWRQRFAALGATTNSAPWDPESIRAALRETRPTLIFALLGTTRARAERDRAATYEAVDYGLTHLLLEAARAEAPEALFIYLSSIGAREDTRNGYLAARGRIERALRDSGMRHLVARPAFISGDDRDEPRPVERLAARILDGALGVVARIGGTGLRERYASLDGVGIGTGLVRLALQGREGIVGPREIRDGDAG